MAIAELTGLNCVSVSLELDEARQLKDALAAALSSMTTEDHGFGVIKEVFEELNRIKSYNLSY